MLEVVLSDLVSLVINTLDSVEDIVGCVVYIGCEVLVSLVRRCIKGYTKCFNRNTWWCNTSNR